MACYRLARASLILIIVGLSAPFTWGSDRLVLWDSPANNGLASTQVVEVFQDDTGAIWIATQEGLHRYDGKEVDRFVADPGVEGSILQGAIVGLGQTDAHHIWVATSVGLQTIDPNDRSALHQVSLPDLPIRVVSDMVVDATGVVWILTPQSLVAHRPATQHVEVVPIEAPIYIAPGLGGGILANIPGTGITRLWMEGDNAVSQQLVAPLNAVPSTTKLAESPGVLWLLGSDGELYQFSTSEKTLSKTPTGSNIGQLPVATIRNITVSGKRLFIATSQGLVVSSDQEHFYLYDAYSHGLIYDFVNTAFESSDGIVWIGTSQGLTQAAESPHKTLNSNNSALINDYVGAVVLGPDGSLFVGTDAGVDITRTGSKPRSIRINNAIYDNLLDNVVTTLALDTSDQQLYLGTFEGGAYRFDLGSLTLHPLTSIPGERASGVTDILVANNGDVYVSSFGDGLRAYRDDVLVAEWAVPEIVTALFEDELGQVFVGTNNGLWEIDGDGERKYRQLPVAPDGVSDPSAWRPDIILALGPGVSGKPWVSIANLGVFEVDLQSQRLIAKNEEFDIPSLSVLAFVKHDSGLWMSHSKGLSKIAPDGSTHHVSSALGGASAQAFNMAAGAIGPSGELFFGGDKGLTIVDPEAVEHEARDISVSLSEIRVAGKPIVLSADLSAQNPLEIDYDESIVDIEFFAPEYFEPNSIQYQYRVLGLGDEEIIPKFFERTVTVPTKEPGNYIIEVAARGVSGDWVWGLSVPITQLPPPWRTREAYFGYVAFGLIVSGLIMLRVRERIRQSKARTGELELAVADRTAALEEANAELQKANSAKSDFLATMSHEIRTPIHGILGMLQLLLDTNLSDSQERFARNAFNSGRTLQGLINDILDLSKIEVGGFELEMVDFDLVDVVGEAVYLLGEPAQSKGLSLYINPDPKCSQSYVGDPQKIRQIVTNLVSNAIKFTSTGHVLISISPRDDFIDLNVEDTGIGIPIEARETIFDKFQQVDAGTTRKYGGSGLGLAIAKSFAELMGGNLEILDTESGIGTRMRASLKLVANPTAAPAPGQSLAIISEDPRLITSVLCSAQYRGFRIVSPDQDQNVDVLLVDENLAPERIKAIEDAYGDTSLVLMCNVHSLSRRLQSERWRQLTKPITPESLNAVIMPNPLSDAKTNHKIFSGSVLVVEDNETNQLLAEEMLTNMGLDVVLAINGQEAIEVFETRAFDLILMDCQMPVMDGFEATKRIRDYEARMQCQRTPIIAASAGVTRDEVEETKAAGMDDFVGKPAQYDDLKNVIARFLTVHEADDDNAESAGRLDEPVEELLDAKTLDGLLSIGSNPAGLVEKLLSSFETTSQGYRDELLALVDTDDCEALRKKAHALKSSAGNVGARRLMAILGDIEHRAKAGESLTSETAEHLVETLRNSTVALRRWQKTTFEEN